MKGLFFRLLQQSTVLLLALVLGIGVAYFLLRYVPQRTESLNKRYFQVLAHIGKGLVEADPITSRSLAPAARPVQPQIPGNAQGTAFSADTSLTGKRSQKNTAATAGSSTWQPAQGLLDSLRRRDVFTHFFVVDLATRRLLYSSSPTGFYLDEAPLSRSWPRWLADSSAAHGSRTAELLLNGETYRLFAQPVRLRSGAGVLLCGTVPNEQFNKDRWSLPAGWPTTILGLVLLGVLALPFLKLWLMSTREQLERIDVAYCAAALVLGSGILLLTIQALLVRYGSGQDQIDQQLTGLSKVVSSPLQSFPSSTKPPGTAVDSRSPDSLRRVAAAEAGALEAWSILEKQPLPPGFDFCLVDHQGKVLYHANPSLRQSENLLDDCLPGTKVRAALFEQTTFVGDVTYQGKPTRLHITPLGRPASSDYVVTFFDLRYAKTHQLQVWMLALELLAGFWLFGLLFWLAHRLVVRHTDRWPLNRDSFKHFWPCNGYALRYWRVVLGQLGALALLVTATKFTQPLTQLYLLLVVPVQLYLLTFRYTRLKSSLPDRPQDFNPLFRTFMLVGIFLTAVTTKYCFLLYSNQSAFNWPAKLLLGFEGIQIILAYGIYLSQRWKILANSRWLAIGKKVLAGLLILGGTAVFLLPDSPELVKVLAARIALSALLWSMWYRVFGLWQMTSIRNWMAKHDWWGYGGVVLGWVLLLGLASAFICYRVAYLTEQLYEVRHSQLAMTHVPHNIGSQPNAKFFFGTTDGTWTVAETNSQVAANLSVLAGLHTTVDTLLAKSALALQPAMLAGKPLWYVSTLTNDDSLTVRTTVAGHTYQSRVSTRLPTWYYWLGGGLVLILGIGLYHLIPRIFTVVAGPPTKLIQLDREEADLLPKVTVPVHHYWLIPGGSDWRDAARWFIKLLLTPHPQAEDIFDCRLLFAEQHLGKAPKASLKKTDKITDKARFKNLLQTASESSTPTLDAASPIVLTHFDYRSGDALVTQHKRQSIEALLLTGRPLLVLSSIHPMGFSDCGPTAAPENQQRVRESGFELLDVLSNFRLQYFSLRWLNQPRTLPGLEHTPVDTALKPEDFRDAVARAQALLFKDDQLLQKFFDKECGAFPFVEALRDDVLGALWRQRALEHEEASRLLTLNNDAQRATDKLATEKSSEAVKAADEAKAIAREAEAATRKENWWTKPTHEAIADTIRRLAWLHFQRLWRSLSAQERFLLYDLAYDGLVNSSNRHHLHNLLHKGLLRLDEYGRLHVASEGFRAFIFAAQRRPDALRYAEDATDDTWGIVKPPLVLLLVAGALLIAVTYPSQQIQQVLALLATVVSLISLLFRTPMRATPSAAKGE